MYSLITNIYLISFLSHISTHSSVTHISYQITHTSTLWSLSHIKFLITYKNLLSYSSLLFKQIHSLISLTCLLSGHSYISMISLTSTGYSLDITIAYLIFDQSLKSIGWQLIHFSSLINHTNLITDHSYTCSLWSLSQIFSLIIHTDGLSGQCHIWTVQSITQISSLITPKHELSHHSFNLPSHHLQM